jgi:hypothetical protein
MVHPENELCHPHIILCLYFWAEKKVKSKIEVIRMGWR